MQEQVGTEQLSAARMRMRQLGAEAASSPDAAARLFPQTYAELATALEELQVAHEELLYHREEEASTGYLLQLQAADTQQLFDAAPIPYLVTDGAGLIIEANRTAARMLGVPRERLARKPLTVFVAEADRRAFTSNIRSAADGSLDQWLMHVLPRASQPVTVRVRAAAIPRPSGAAAALVLLPETTADVGLASSVVTPPEGASPAVQAHFVAEAASALSMTFNPVARVGVMLLVGPGEGDVAAASDATTQDLEALQLKLDEGPCLDATRSGLTVSVADMEAEGIERWPIFGRTAVNLGVRAVHSVPLRAGGTIAGAMNLYLSGPMLLSDKHAAAAQLLADMVAAMILTSQQAEAHMTLSAQLTHALESRVIIEQAKGVIAANTGTAPDAAFEVMRSYARSKRIKLRTVAESVVAGVLKFD